MKKIAILGAALISLTACEKRDGYMFKAFHVKPVPPGHYWGLDTMWVTDFFYMETIDSASAWEYYQTTEAHKSVSPRFDSTWVEYYCTWDEWQEK